MCGHDGHISTLLLAACLLSKFRSKISENQKVILIFQPAEEGLAGALPMIDGNCLEMVEEIYALHNMP